MKYNMDSSIQNQNQQVAISEVPVTNQTEAFQLLIYFINVAQKRGTFTIDESAKLYECIKLFKST